MNGNTCHPGTKVKFVVVNNESKISQERVLLEEEISFSENANKRPDFSYYRVLAVRALWSILAPFGWDEDEIIRYSKKRSLEEFMHS